MTKQIGKILILGLLAILAAFGQSGPFFQPGTMTSSLTASGSTCAGLATTNCVEILVDAQTAWVAFQVSGTFSATLTFEASTDGQNWVAWPAIADGSGTTQRAYVATATVAGIWQMNVAGFTYARVRCSAYTSGAAVVFARKGAAGGIETPR